jgi:hypothetical protein
MAFRNFNVGPAKGLKRAAYEGLPNLVAIAGPNGAGKSTLLHQLYVNRSQADPGTRTIYLGPHRPWRKTTLGGAAMYALQYSFRQFLETEGFPGFQQIVPTWMQHLQYLGGQPRIPDTADESYSFVKYSIAKLGFRRQARVAQEFDQRGGMIPANTIPDVFEPLRELTRYLLPHLRFELVDTHNEQDYRVLFRRTDGDERDVIDIDDLSSGEKAIISLFLPFLESQIEELILGAEGSPEPALTTALIDEPDLHLHPSLQVSLVEYLREMADRGLAQFIITTHSPTILDSLNDDELFLVAPVASVGDGNQFLRVTSSEERLEAIRGLTGSTHLVTRCRPIVFLEGVDPAEKAASDQRLVELLIPEAVSWVLVPAGGRGEAVRSATKLRSAATENLPGIPVFALIDADQGNPADPDYAITWPVAMIENLLIDHASMWSLLIPHQEHISLASETDVKDELRAIARSLRDDEIRLRFFTLMKTLHVRIDPIKAGGAEAAITAAQEELDTRVNALGGPAAINAAHERAEQEVDRILTEGRELEAFRGKDILRRFHNQYASDFFWL